jgi:uncharacterized LabA/DUF88 family protein/cold shock CspA family protein
MTDQDAKLLRVGVFYDGNFFYHVSNYYKYAHPRQRRISIPGLHEFIRHHVADVEGADVRYCHIVDAHFFRGRFSAKDADAKQKLYVERVFDDILMGEGVVTHYLPLRQGTEKGIDVWLALEAFELAVYKRFNVLVLIAGDGDFVPLARKVNSLGTRVMVLGWDFKYTDEIGQERETVTSIHLLNEVTYPILMHTIIDDKTKRDDALIKSLFVESRGPSASFALTPSVASGPPAPTSVHPTQQSPAVRPTATPSPEADATRVSGKIQNILQGYGFIKSAQFPSNIFFYWSEVTNADFNDLKIGDSVTFVAGKNERGPVALDVRVE